MPRRIVFELLEGSLLAVVRAAGLQQRLTFKEQVDIAIGCAAGTSRLHLMTPNPIFHGSITSTNVLVTVPKIAFPDRALGNGPSCLWYVPPESVATSTWPSEAADSYSLGIVLSEVFTGEECYDVSEDVLVKLEELPDNRCDLKDMCKELVKTDGEQRLSVQSLCDNLFDVKRKVEYTSSPPKRLVKRSHETEVELY